MGTCLHNHDSRTGSGGSSAGPGLSACSQLARGALAPTLSRWFTHTGPPRPLSARLPVTAFPCWQLLCRRDPAPLAPETRRQRWFERCCSLQGQHPLCSPELPGANPSTPSWKCLVLWVNADTGRYNRCHTAQRKTTIRKSVYRSKATSRSAGGAAIADEPDQLL